MRLLIFLLILQIGLPAQAEQSSFFAASTPCDAELKVHLGLDTSTAIDFIRWQVNLHHQKNEEGQFELKINYGIGQNNTLGFINGGEHRQFQGKYTIESAAQGPILHLQAPGLELHLLQVHANLLHFIDNHEQLKIGNGGWSYCLNRQSDLAAKQGFLASFSSLSLFEKDQLQATFDGRTPCAEISNALDLGLSKSCIKLKWRIIFQQSEANSQAGTLVMKRIFRQAEQTNGRWTIENKDGRSQIKLQFENTDKTMYLLQAGEGVLIFLDQQGRPYIGNADFSFGLNRKR
jgi:hypothetical protein